MRIALAQLHSCPGDQRANIEKVGRVLSALSSRADLVVFPELFLSGYYLAADEDLERCALELPPAAAFPPAAAPAPAGGDAPLHPLLQLSALARDSRTALCVSFPERAAGSLSLFITAAVFDSDGALAAAHRKTQLWGAREHRLFAPGGGPFAPFALAAFPAVPLGLLICFELEFPEPARVLALRGARALLCVAASGEANSFTSLRFAPVRAAENGAALAWVNFPDSPPPGVPSGVAFSGGSGAWGPDGAPLHGAGGEAVDGEASQAATAAVAALPGERVCVVCVDVDGAHFAAHRERNPYLAARRAELFQQIL